ncbi:hypothetical protein ACUNV4_17535 [Granulosicoccus sp. 3-233]
MHKEIDFAKQLSKALEQEVHDIRTTPYPIVFHRYFISVQNMFKVTIALKPEGWRPFAAVHPQRYPQILWINLQETL